MTEIHSIKFDASNMSAFGTLETGELTPIVQSDFVYGLNSQIWQSGVVSGNGAIVDTNASRLRVQSGTGSSGYAYIQNRRPVRYRAGQGSVARFTPLFTAGVVNNVQMWGMGAIAANVVYDGYFFGYNGTSFGIVHYVRGTPTWYAQTTDWNGDKVNGSAGSSFTWNPTLGSPVQIKYPYLGYGDIEFFVQNPTTSRWVLVHVIRYANTVVTTQLSNPTMYFTGFTLNSGNTTNMIMYCASVGVFISGERSFIGNPKWAVDSYKTGIGNTETSLIGVRNCTTYNTVVNRGLIRLSSFSASSSANTTVFIRFKINATVSTTPSFTPVNGSTADNGITITTGNSITSYDTTATTVTGAGSYIYNFSLGSSSVGFIDLVPFGLFIAPTEILTVSGYGVGSTNIGLSLNFTEDI